MKSFLKRVLKKWCLNNFPLEVTTKFEYCIYVKKGKIREWRTYNGNHERIA